MYLVFIVLMLAVLGAVLGVVLFFLTNSKLVKSLVGKAKAFLSENTLWSE